MHNVKDVIVKIQKMKKSELRQIIREVIQKQILKEQYAPQSSPNGRAVSCSTCDINRCLSTGFDNMTINGNAPEVGDVFVVDTSIPQPYNPHNATYLLTGSPIYFFVTEVG